MGFVVVVRNTQVFQLTSINYTELSHNIIPYFSPGTAEDVKASNNICKSKRLHYKTNPTPLTSFLLRGNGYGSVSLPHIPNAPSLVKKDEARPLSDTRKKKRKEAARTNLKEEQPMKNNSITENMELSGTTAVIKSKHYASSNKVICYAF